MRTATPFVTCSVITDAGPSATSAAISTPRFIGPGCITSASLRSRAGALDREPVPRGVLAQAREQRLALALALDAQQVDHVELGEHVVEVVRDRDRPAGERRRQQRRRRDERDVGAERGERERVAARDARVRRCRRRSRLRAPSSDAPRWRRSVSRSSSACVGCSWQPSPALIDAGVDPGRDPVGRTGGGVAHDDRVDAHRLDRLHGVAQALALLHRRRRHRERHDVAREPLRRGLERDAGAGASPRRTATPPPCRAAPAPSGCRAG